MQNPIQLEACFQKFISNLNEWAHDGVIRIDLPFLESEGLLHQYDNPMTGDQNHTLQFSVIESDNKVTLFNKEYAIWIVPVVADNQNGTLVLIGLNDLDNSNSIDMEPNIKLEITFLAEGMYNSSKVVLKMLEHFLYQIKETDEVLKKLESGYQSSANI